MLARCNQCMEVFDEEEVIYNVDENKDECPMCGEVGCLMDLDAEKEIINNIKFSFSRSSNQTAHMFSEGHIKYNCVMTYNGVTLRQTYQCNPSVHKTDSENMRKDFLWSVLLDTQSYDYSRDIKDFADNFGYDIYENKKEVNRVWKACERESIKIHEMFNDEELKMLADYYKEW